MRRNSRFVAKPEANQKRARARISAKTKSWETASQRAKEWADNHDPVILRERAREADNAVTPKLIEDAFYEFIAIK